MVDEFERAAKKKVTKFDILSMWFLQARCGLLFSTINHTQEPILRTMQTYYGLDSTNLEGVGVNFSNRFTFKMEGLLIMMH